MAVAWPYANGPLHLGHIAGAYLPSDIFARYHRLRGNRVLMVSGSDAHGTPITVRADAEGVEPADVVNRFHPLFLETWERLGISFDLFTTTMTENHAAVTQDVFTRARERGFIDIETSQQMFDPEVGRFLPDRYVEGTCPHCGYPDARGDQCENCGRTLDPADLINPRSKLSGATPELRDTDHFFLLLSKLEPDVLAWLETRVGWRKHVINWAIQFVKDGLHDRAITRDITWGVPLPTDELGDSKRIYVWFDAVSGYLSASVEWAEASGDPEAWRTWWDPTFGAGATADSYYFIGKDNIPFHTVFWPAILLARGGLNLPTDVPANQYVTFKGSKASKSAGVGRGILEYLDVLQPDAIRYALASVLPEQNDTDFTDDELVRRVNDELVAVWGNLVNRVFSMIARNFDGVVPRAEAKLSDADRGRAGHHGRRRDRRDRAPQIRAGRAARRLEGGDGSGAGRQRLPQRGRAVEAGEGRPRGGRHRAAPGSPGHRRHQRGAVAVRPGLGGRRRGGARPDHVHPGRKAPIDGTVEIPGRPRTIGAPAPAVHQAPKARCSSKTTEGGSSPGDCVGRGGDLRRGVPGHHHPAGQRLRVRAAGGAAHVDPRRPEAGRGHRLRGRAPRRSGVMSVRLRWSGSNGRC